VLMAPVVLTEVLSDPKLPSDVAQMLSQLPLLEIKSGYREPAGLLRSKVLAKRRKARLGDALMLRAALIVGFLSLRGAGAFARSLKQQP
jgi:hypothetical protein